MAHIIYHLEVGGAELFLHDLALALAASALTQHVFCVGAGGPLATGLADAGIPVTALGKRTRLGLMTILTLARALRAFRADVVQTHGEAGVFWGIPAARLAVSPAVCALIYQNYLETRAKMVASRAGSMDRLNQRRLSTLRYERPQDIERYLDFHLDRIEALTLGILRGRGYDVVLACLAPPDIAHHYFWRRDDPGALERIYRVYEKVDRAIGRFVAEVPDAAHLILLSDHGGGPAPSRVFQVNRWLSEQGWLALRPSAGRSVPLVPLVNRCVQWAKRLRLNQRLAPLLTGGLRERVSALTHNDAFVDWGRSRAFGMSFFYPLAGIEVNLRGRQAQGTVQPGAEYEALVREIVQALEALRDPGTGQQVCARVCRREELFDGPHLERFPDVVAVLDADYDTRTTIAASAFGPNDMQWEYPDMGYHHREGIFVVRGPAVTPGACFPPAEMADIAPTLLHLAGVPAPQTVEGRVLAL